MYTELQVYWKLIWNKKKRGFKGKEAKPWRIEPQKVGKGGKRIKGKERLYSEWDIG